MTTNILGERTHIDVRAIERELTALWKQAAEGQDEGGQAVTRTCVLNLVVATSGGRAVDDATDTIARLTARHPNRAIVINAAPGAAQEMLDAWVQAHCQMPGPGRPQVCCEQISFLLEGESKNLIPNIVFSHLDSDLPLHLWWQGEFPEPIDWTWIGDAADLLLRSLACRLPRFAAWNAVGDRRSVGDAFAHLKRRFPDLVAVPIAAETPACGWGLVNDGVDASLGPLSRTRLETGIDRMISMAKSIA